jgi:hypothetical protein
MARPRNKHSSRLTRDAERLVALSLALNGSGSRVEDRFWERELEGVLGKQLRTAQDATIESALEVLFQSNPGGYEILVEHAETLSECTVLEKNGQLFDVLLVVAPVVAWTRYVIPSGPVRADLLDALRAQLHGHVLAANTRLALAPELYSVDQMPRSFSATQQWLNQMGAQALELPVTRAPKQEAEVANLLADTRYLVGAVAVPHDEPIFRWQEAGLGRADRDACLKQWAAQATPLFADLLPGCGFECLLPDAYYVSNREADRRVRPLSLRAAVTWLEGALSIAPDQIRAVIGGCGEIEIEEYRVGFTARNSNDVVYGCVWPLFGREDDHPDAPAQEEIATLLRELGVTDIRRLPGLLPLEFCEDCGAPHFPNPVGEMVHAEPPEETPTASAHFH